MEGVKRFISDHQLYALPSQQDARILCEEGWGKVDIRHKAFVRAETRAGGSEHQLSPILHAEPSRLAT